MTGTQAGGGDGTLAEAVNGTLAGGGERDSGRGGERDSRIGGIEDLDALIARRAALREAAALPGADPRALLDAALAELDGALGLLGTAPETATSRPGADGGAEAERRLLRAVFQQAPVPMFVLEPDGTVRRANEAAGRLTAIPAGYATGRPLTAFIDPASRAAVASQLAAAGRGGEERQVDCRIIGRDGPAGAVLTVRSVLRAGAEPAGGGAGELLVAVLTSAGVWVTAMAGRYAVSVHGPG